MSTEPPLDRAALLGLVRSAFGLDAQHLTFIPNGTAPAYRVDGPGTRAFLKVMPDTVYGAQVTARALAEVPLLPEQDEHALELISRYSLPALLSVESDLERVHLVMREG